MRVQATSAEYRREGCVRPQPPDEPDQISPDGDGDAEKHSHVEGGSRQRRADTSIAVRGELIEHDDGGRNGDKGDEAEQSKSREPSDGRSARRGQALPRYPLFFDLERCCLQLLHVLQYNRIPPVENRLEITPLGDPGPCSAFAAKHPHVAAATPTSPLFTTM